MAVLKHQKKMVLVLFIVFLTLTAGAVHKIPKKFTSSALFNFHSDFAKVPASSEFFSEIYDPNELRAEKEAILLGVLSDDFLSRLTRKYLGHDSADLEWRVQGLRKDIRFVPLSRTTYQLIVDQQNPQSTQGIALEILNRLEETLRNERLIRMRSVYASVSQQLNELKINSGETDLSVQANAARLRIETEIEKLQTMYTAEHPRLARLRSQLNTLSNTTKYDALDPLGRGQIENWASLRGILLTRQALLQVAIRMEEKGTLSHIKIVKSPDLPQWPSSPKKNVLYASAALSSLVFSFAAVSMLRLTKELMIFFPELRRAWSEFRRNLKHKPENQ
jgi:uncharacterized protein involved in exopolysaccharide biosynthesis